MVYLGLLPESLRAGLKLGFDRDVDAVRVRIRVRVPLVQTP